MLPKVNRLTKKKDLDRVFKEGEGLVEDFLLVKFLKSNLKNSRFGFIVSSKVAKRSTLRNKIKRRLRELIRLRLNKIKTGFDLIILARPGLESKDFWEMEESLDKILKKARLLK